MLSHSEKKNDIFGATSLLFGPLVGTVPLYGSLFFKTKVFYNVLMCFVFMYRPHDFFDVLIYKTLD